MTGLCPTCNRPVAMARPQCVYCGAVLPAEAAFKPTPSAAPASAGADRAVLVFDVAASGAAALRAALGLTVAEAEMRVRRGGFQVHRILPAAEAEAEVSRFASLGVRVLRVAEADVVPALQPLEARSGRWHGGRLQVEAGDGALAIGQADVSVIVRGPISRERPPADSLRRIRFATLEPGYRFHIHRKHDRRPVEIDPGNFTFPPELSRALSSTLEIANWLLALAPTVAHDDTFKHQAPAFGLEEEAAEGPAALLAAHRTPPKRRGEPSAILDNLRQFRFFSGVRGAVERAMS